MALLPRTALFSVLLVAAAGCGAGNGGSGSSSLLPSAGYADATRPAGSAVRSITVSPDSLQFAGVGAPAQTFTATLSQGGGQLGAASSNTAVATVTQGNGRNSSTFTVTPVGLGSADVTVSDRKGATAAVLVTVGTPATPTPAPNAPAVLHQFPMAMSEESFGVANAADGSVWYTQWYSGSVGDMSQSGSNSNFAVNGKPYGITLGSDGNFWVVDRANARVETLSPSGSFGASYMTGYTPMEIAKGPDGNVWITVEDTGGSGFSEIVQLTPSGAMQSFPTSTAAQTAGRLAYDITPGPDGRMWFTEGNYIAAITTNGAISEYPVPSGRSTNFITPGPDGNLWFTEEYGNAVGRITPSGSVTEYAVPTLFANPWMIAAGKDGAVWFTEAGGTGQIGRVDPTGTVVEYPVPNISGNPAILAGSDGNLWIPSGNGIMYVLSY